MSTSSAFPELLLEQEEGSEFSAFDGDAASNDVSTKTGGDEKKSALQQLASQETTRVQRVRILLVGVIVMGIVVCLGAYFFVNQEAENDYKISVSNWFFLGLSIVFFVESNANIIISIISLISLQMPFKTLWKSRPKICIQPCAIWVNPFPTRD